jgi:hypothetical protein
MNEQLRELLAEARCHNLITPVGYKRGATAYGAWTAGYMSALKDISEAKLHTNQQEEAR